jgi:hypothetical protein
MKVNNWPFPLEFSREIHLTRTTAQVKGAAAIFAGKASEKAARSSLTILRCFDKSFSVAAVGLVVQASHSVDETV